MTDTSPLSDVDLDRLVDGEMSDEERRDTLLLLEADSDGGDWRRCALAFLEAQTWSHVLADTFKYPIEPIHSATLGAPSSPSPLRQGPERTQTERKSEPAQTRTSMRGRMSWTAWLTIAAAIMIAFGMGIASERLPHRFDDPMWLASDANPPRDPLAAPRTPDKPSPEQRPAQDLPSGLTLVVHDEAGGSQQVDVPIVDWKAGEDWLEAGSVTPHEDEIHNRLIASGNHVGRREQYFAPIETPDGRRFVVPIQRWEIVPVSADDFQ